MNPVFLDTVGLIAVWDRADQWHAAANPVYLALLGSGRSLVTTSLVLYECGNTAARRTYRTSVNDLRNWLVARKLLIEPTATDIDQAWNDYARRLYGSAGIVDCVSFAVMRRLGLSDAFTNDRHFVAAGLNCLF